jgi:ribosome-binding factor A
MKSFQRSDRVASSLKKELSALLMKEVKVGEFGLVTITDVKLTGDLSRANVYVTALNIEDDKHIKKLEALLNSQTFMLENLLFKILKLRIAPKLTFIYDNSIAYGAKMSALINKAITTEATTDEQKTDEEWLSFTQ